MKRTEVEQMKTFNLIFGLHGKKEKLLSEYRSFYIYEAWNGPQYGKHLIIRKVRYSIMGLITIQTPAFMSLDCDIEQCQKTIDSIIIRDAEYNNY